MSETMQDRKRFLHLAIKEAQQRYCEAIEPFIKELAQIAACEPPAPFVLPDGTAMVYVGPLPEWTGPRSSNPS